MIPAIYFREELEKSSIIDEFICKSWKENSSKDNFREVIRKIETQGASAFELEDEITELMKKADVIFVVLATIGLSYVLQNAAMLIWGSNTKRFPQIFAMSVIKIGSVNVQPESLFGIILAVSLFLSIRC